jgi:predicted outer membrane protein
MTVLFLCFAALAWNACSKDHSFEKSNQSVDNPPPPGDSTGNGDSTSGNEGEDPQPAPPDDSTTSIDFVFLQNATYVNRAQLNNAALAKERGTAQSVRDFATAVSTRFTQAQSDIEKLGSELQADIPAQTDAAHQAVTKSFLDLEGSTFDIAYIDYQLMELQTTIDMYRRHLTDGSDAKVKAYAGKYLPYLEQFLQSASTIRQSL